MLIWRAAVGKEGPWTLGAVSHSPGKVNTASSGRPGIYAVKSAKYSSAEHDTQGFICCLFWVVSLMWYWITKPKHLQDDCK